MTPGAFRELSPITPNMSSPHKYSTSALYNLSAALPVCAPKRHTDSKSYADKAQKWSTGFSPDCFVKGKARACPKQAVKTSSGASEGCV